MHIHDDQQTLSRQNPALHVHWKQLPDKSITLGCLDSPGARQRITCIFTTLSSLSLGVTAYAAIKFSAIPFAGIYIVGGLVLLTLVSCIATFAACRLRPSVAELAYDLRHEAELELNVIPNKRPGYAAMRSKYPVNIISDEEFNKLVFADAHTLSYIQFIDKHGLNSIEVLDPVNKEALKPRYIIHKKVNKDILDQQILIFKESRNLGLIERDFRMHAVTSNVTSMMTFGADTRKYMQFLEENKENGGEQAIGLINNKEAKKWLEQQFLAYISQLISPREAPGLLQLNQTHKIALELFDPETRESFRKTILQRELIRVQSNVISLNDLVVRNGSDVIRNHFDKVETEVKHQWCKKFLQSSCQELISTSEVALSIIDLKPDQIQWELQTRWSRVSFGRTEEIRKQGLFASIGTDGRKVSAFKLTAQALRQTARLPVGYIAQEIFDAGILHADSRLANQRSLKERLESELAGCKKLEDFSGCGKAFLFKHKLISKDEPNLQKLIKEAVSKDERTEKARIAISKIFKDHVDKSETLSAFRKITELTSKKQKLEKELDQIQQKLILAEKTLEDIIKEKEELERNKVILQQKLDTNSTTIDELHSVVWNPEEPEQEDFKLHPELMQKQKTREINLANKERKLHEDLQKAEEERKELDNQYKELDQRGEALNDKRNLQRGIVNDLKGTKTKKQRNIEKIKASIKEFEGKLKDVSLPDYAEINKELDVAYKARWEAIQASEARAIELMTLMVMGEADAEGTRTG